MAYRYRLKRKRWIVYGLFEPGIKQPFYIGVTYDLQVRAARHYYRKHGIRKRIETLKTAGKPCIVRSLAFFANRLDAGIYERVLIAENPTTLNHRNPLVNHLAKVFADDFAYLKKETPIEFTI